MIYLDQTQAEQKKAARFRLMADSKPVCVRLGFPIAVTRRFSSFKHATDDGGASTTAATVMNHHTCDDPASTRCMRLSPNGYYYYFFVRNYLTHSNWFSHRENERLVYD